MYEYIFIGNTQQPALVTVTTSQTAAISCAGLNDGQATALANGGTGVLNYLWSNGQSNAVANGLNNGNYSVTVIDANGCSSTSSVTLTDPPGMASSAAVSSAYNGADISCFGATDGELTASVSGERLAIHSSGLTDKRMPLHLDYLMVPTRSQLLTRVVVRRSLRPLSINQHNYRSTLLLRQHFVMAMPMALSLLLRVGVRVHIPTILAQAIKPRLPLQDYPQVIIPFRLPMSMAVWPPLL